MNRLAMVVGVIGLLLLCLLCPWCRAPAIEDDVRQAASACAADAGLGPEQVSVSGRDVTLTGVVASQEVHDRVVSCIEGFAGTRVVHDGLQIVLGGSLKFTTRYDDIAIVGVVPTAESRGAIIDTAVTLWGDDKVNRDLEVDASRTLGGWVDDDFAMFLAALHHSRRDLEVELTEGKAIVSGTVLSELAKFRVLGAAVALLPEFEVVDRLKIREPIDDREVLQLDLDTLLDGKVVEFEIDSAKLTAQGREVLNEVGGILKRHPGKVEISGHTDSTGTPEHNFDLSRQRAESAAAYLIANGIERDRCITVGFGQTRPISSNATEDGRQANRRTEFHALKEN